MPRAASSTPKARRATSRRTDRQDRLGRQSASSSSILKEHGALLGMEKHRALAIRTAGAATIRPSSAPPSSGSSAWSATTSAANALEAIKNVKWMPDLGRRAHLQHDRHAARLVHLAPARLGRADHRVLLRGLPRAADRSQDSGRRRRPVRGAHGRHLVSSDGRGTAAGRAQVRQVRRRRSSARRPTFWTSGSIPARAIWPC